MKKYYLLLLAVFLGVFGVAQTPKNGFELTVKIDGYPEGSKLSLGRYYADKQYFVDTAAFDKKRGVYVFKRPERLEGGMHMLISFENVPAELIIDQDQQFSVEMQYPAFGSDMKFKNSPENQINQDFNNSVRPHYIEFDKFRKEYDSLADKKSPEGGELLQKIQNSLDEVEKIKVKFMEDNPKHLMTAVFKAQKEVEVPEAPAELSEIEKQQWRYNYYMNHYFDNFDLTDDRLLRTPLFHQRLESYLEKLPQHPDSLKFGIERLVEKTRKAPELFKYVVWYTVDKYQRSQIIGYDAVWVYLAKKYYVSGDAFWASKSVIENFENHINR